MKMMKFLSVALTFSSVGLANVTGKKVENLGAAWQKKEFKEWVTSPGALLTPESTNLAIQACLRKSQEAIDPAAYALVLNLTKELKANYQFVQLGDGGDAYAAGLAALAHLLEGIQSIKARSADDYTRACKAQYRNTLKEQVIVSRGVKAPIQKLLEPIYEGRMHPGIPDSLPQDIKDKLKALSSRGVKVSPLTWDVLEEQICELEGYYSTSFDERLWKFFSSTRAMANVLPKAERSAEFLKTASKSSRIVSLIKTINDYSAVAGRPNGASIGMTRSEIDKAGVRLTGPALGSNAVALMAFFTTAWRERIQKHVIDQNYPQEPFQLVSAENLINWTQETANDRKNRKTISQTEIGMTSAWNSVYYQYVKFTRAPDEQGDLGENTEAYRKAAALAWLALNAETNIRQNEKIGGLRAALPIEKVEATRWIYGKSETYQELQKELEAALAAYHTVDPQAEPSCVKSLEGLTTAAAKALGNTPDVRELDAKVTQFLTDVEFKPIIADIGLEVDDTEGNKPEGVHRLHLATGYGRVVPASFKDKKYTVWTPSGLVLHLKALTSTAKWQGGLVNQYDN